MSKHVKLTMTVKAVDGEADISIVMRLDRVPVVGDSIDTYTDESDPEGINEHSHVVTGVVLSSRFFPAVTLAAWEVNRDEAWGDNHRFDGGSVFIGLREILDSWFDVWEVDELRTVWDHEHSRWQDPAWLALIEGEQP